MPLVLKNKQAYAGAGTYVIDTEKDRAEVIDLFSNGLLRKLFSKITSSNAHLKPGTILISNKFVDPIGDYGLTFFVTDSGGVIFLGVSEQLLDSKSSWIGSTMDYGRQEKLEKKFSPLLGEDRIWLHETAGYFGAVGADVIGGGSGVRSERTQLMVVDLNVRIPGSICLCLMRGHFESRGLHFSGTFSITTKSTRDQFVEGQREDFESGRLCIHSWCEDKNTEVSTAYVALGGETRERLEEEAKKIRDVTGEVTF